MACQIDEQDQSGRRMSSDVLGTYFVFLRTVVLTGQLKLEAEQRLVGEAKQWLEGRAGAVDVYRLYLDHRGDWDNPRASAPLTDV